MSKTHSFAQKMSSHLSVLLTGLLALVALPAACGGDAVSVTQLSLSGPSSLVAGRSGQMTATAKYSDGSSKDVTALATWSSGDVTILTVSNDSQSRGQIKGVAAALVHVQAALEGQSGDAEVTVSAAELETLALSPQSASLALGTTVQLTAMGTYSDGSTKDVTALAQWNSDDQDVLQVSGDLGTMGLVTALMQGSAHVRASLGNVIASIEITVSAPLLASMQLAASAAVLNVGDSVQLSSTGAYTDETTQDLTESVSWTSSDESVLSISNSDGSRGMATAMGAGTVTVTATLGDVVATYDLTIN